MVPHSSFFFLVDWIPRNAIQDRNRLSKAAQQTGRQADVYQLKQKEFGIHDNQAIRPFGREKRKKQQQRAAATTIHNAIALLASSNHFLEIGNEKQ